MLDGQFPMMIVPRCFLSWRGVASKGYTLERRCHWHSEAVEGRKKEDLAVAQKEEEDREANNVGLIAAKKEKIATLTATIDKLREPQE